MMQKNAIRRRVLPFTPLDLMLEEQGGGNYRLELRLAFDMNAAAAIQEKTAEPRVDFRGYMLTDFAIWAHVGEPKLLKAMLWAAMLAYQPEYDSHEGFDTVGTFIQEGNAKEICEALEKAYFAFLPKEKVEAIQRLKADAEKKSRGEQTEDPLGEKAAATSIGSSSGPSPATTSDLPWMNLGR